MRDSDKMYRRAKELEKRLEKMEVMKRPVLEKRKIRLEQVVIGRSGKIVMETSDVSKSFGNQRLFEEVNLHLYYQDSACIIGANGCGKTTLLKLLLGEMEPEKGNIKMGSQVIIGYLPQQVEFQNEEQTILEYFSELHGIPYGEARAQLAKVLFMNDDVNKKIRFLSGGEKSRLKLCSLTFTGVNLLLLDEPTNHLDIDSREVLEDTLGEFDGTILFVSHDRYFINKIADKIIAIKDGKVKEYSGDYQYYQEEYQKEQEVIISVSPEPVRAKAPTPVYQKERNRPAPQYQKEHNREVQKLEYIEKSILELEERIKELEERMNLHQSDAAHLEELYGEKEQLELELDRAYSEWDALQS
jgi:ATP-binding cassette, subfamily F, member 3